MTDIPAEGSVPGSGQTSIHTDDAARKRLARRYGAEARFKYMGLAAVLVAALFLVLLLSTIVGQAISAFTYHYATIEVDIPPVENTGSEAELRTALLAVDFNGVVRDAVREKFPYVSGRRDRRALNGLLSSGSGSDLRNKVLTDPSLAGTTTDVSFLLSDFGDLYMKGSVTRLDETSGRGIASPVSVGDQIEILSTSNDFRDVLTEIKQNLSARASALRDEENRLRRIEGRVRGQLSAAQESLQGASGDERARLEAEVQKLQNSADSILANRTRLGDQAEGFENRASAVNEREVLSDDLPSFLINVNGGVLKIAEVDETSARGNVIVPLQSMDDAQRDQWSVDRLPIPESSRKLTDQEIVWVNQLVADDVVDRRFNSVFFTAGASREPEQAGIWGAVVGSFFTMLVTLVLSFPIGVAAAIYLEEFAPKNRLTALIEVNINNLAAVPSIVFGLLGLAMFLNFFHMPRSAPLVGGMVLALMTLPTIIIASRAALKAVPPSIREAALGVGASRIQAVFHHVLPLALPGIMTGTIIGMAQALGETAPLLMIGMVAFIVDIPGGPLDPATVLPVQIFMWADFPEIAFQQKTAAAILILLGFLVLMNLLAVVLRRRFERRW
ncbi:MAG: phosphate ABC transporter permease PstA [Pseudomonadota bacterium]